MPSSANSSPTAWSVSASCAGPGGLHDRALAHLDGQRGDEAVDGPVGVGLLQRRERRRGQDRGDRLARAARPRRRPPAAARACGRARRGPRAARPRRCVSSASPPTSSASAFARAAIGSAHRTGVPTRAPSRAPCCRFRSGRCSWSRSAYPASLSARSTASSRRGVSWRASAKAARTQGAWRAAHASDRGRRQAPAMARQDWLKKPFSINLARSSAEISTLRGVSMKTLSAILCMPPSSA